MSLKILKNTVVHFKYMNCIVCELYLDKAIEENVHRVKRKKL